MLKKPTIYIKWKQVLNKNLRTNYTQLLNSLKEPTFLIVKRIRSL